MKRETSTFANFNHLKMERCLGHFSDTESYAEFYSLIRITNSNYFILPASTVKLSFVFEIPWTSVVNYIWKSSIRLSVSRIEIFLLTFLNGLKAITHNRNEFKWKG